MWVKVLSPRADKVPHPDANFVVEMEDLGEVRVGDLVKVLIKVRYQNVSVVESVWAKIITDYEDGSYLAKYETGSTMIKDPSFVRFRKEEIVDIFRRKDCND